MNLNHLQRRFDTLKKYFPKCENAIFRRMQLSQVHRKRVEAEDEASGEDLRQHRCCRTLPQDSGRRVELGSTISIVLVQT